MSNKTDEQYTVTAEVSDGSKNVLNAPRSGSLLGLAIICLISIGIIGVGTFLLIYGTFEGWFN